jgi:hypothetical protein
VRSTTWGAIRSTSITSHRARPDLDDSILADPDFRNIGNADLISKRETRQVPIPPGGMLSDYIPFYFTPWSPVEDPDQAGAVLRMIRYTQGNLLKAPVEAPVNTVNEVGVMGKGIALVFREAYAESARTYEQACKRGEVRVGHVLVTRNEALFGPRWILHFPTKKHWRHPSRMEWIREGLVDLARWCGRTVSAPWPSRRWGAATVVSIGSWSGPKARPRSAG